MALPEVIAKDLPTFAYGVAKGMEFLVSKGVSCTGNDVRVKNRVSHVEGVVTDRNDIIWKRVYAGNETVSTVVLGNTLVSTTVSSSFLKK